MHTTDSIYVTAFLTLLLLSAAVHAQTTTPPTKPSVAAATLSSASQEMQFSDQPNFSVAGVTDWTAVGGHGSDTTLRTTEALASATAALKPRNPATSNPSLSMSADTGKAETYRITGEHFEAVGDALSAVQSFEQAALLDPSEPNYFAWGSELLLHRAIWQAEEVFRKGAFAYPNSLRMQTALGTALFAESRYDEAAERFCTASDLDPSATEPYLFMGRMQTVAPNALSCIESHLSRFVALQPDNSIANYLYAMSLLKSQEHSSDPATVQRAVSRFKQAVILDPQCGEALLQLGILASAKEDTPNAFRYFISATQATPSLADAHYRLGVLYDRIGDHDKARQEFQLHDQIRQQQAALTEQQRRDIKQFLFAKPGAPSPTSAP